MEIICRKATEEDIPSLFDIIQGYAEQGIMLPRSVKTLQDQLENFVVADFEGEIIGCGSLCKLGQELVEIRSLGVLEQFKGHGAGKKLVQVLVEQAREAGIPKIMALTYEVAFFERIGFTVVSKEIFPEKVWRDCVHCKKQHCCDEIAVLKRLD